MYLAWVGCRDMDLAVFRLDTIRSIPASSPVRYSIHVPRKISILDTIQNTFGIVSSTYVIGTYLPIHIQTDTRGA